MSNKIQQRFDDLLSLANRISESTFTSRSQFSSGTYVDNELLVQWVTKTENLVHSICGSTSTYYVTFTEANQIKGLETNEGKFKRLKSIFIAIKDDFESGYLTSYKSIIQAELFDSELEQAKSLLEAGYFTAAAVIAGTVLETSLRELCERNSLPIGKLDRMNADLAKQGLYNSIQQKKIHCICRNQKQRCTR
ncbi:DUF4145 domain-containing protein, partial [Micrococcus luteus]|uniref:DUF4145 domain-containing protein n=2 Tax=Bacteria TaxID=2 RepID=UPI0012FD73C7